ncbi:MAG: hypothetical protein MUE41_17700, partial [Gemmatimonadaceae bacterium]|nr:hypothetical protein [Gemmatimonadaceae bacterium]
MASLIDLLDAAYAESALPGVPNANNCSGFLVSAATRAGYTLPGGKADALLAIFRKDWDALGTGDAGMKAAVTAATQGRFVVVGGTAAALGDTNGHVAVLTGATRDGWPVLFGGAINPAARSRGEKTLNYVFKRILHPKLEYFAPRATKDPTALPTATLDALGFSTAAHRRVAPPGGLLLYRAWGGRSTEWGTGFFSLQKPQSVIEAELRFNIALWGNGVQWVSTFRLKPGYPFVIGN